MENRTHDREKITRRSLFKSAAAIASATTFPFRFAGAAFSSRTCLQPALLLRSRQYRRKSTLVWFNLLEYFLPIRTG
jgi:hypothetical protein